MSSPGQQAIEDQARAAVRETIQRLEQRARTHPNSAAGEGHPDPWVGALGAWWEQQIRANRVRYCRHILAGGPRPVHGCAWMPGSLACDLCVGLGVFVLTGKADRVCDRCGVDTLGEGIYTGAASLGLVSIEYGLCPGCFRQVKASIEQGGQ